MGENAPIRPHSVVLTRHLLILFLCLTAMAVSEGYSRFRASASRLQPPRPTLSIQPVPTIKKVLSNGLTVIVKEDRAAPVAAVRMYVKTGSIYEQEYLGTGISHLFEHTLGEGTKTRTNTEINQILEEIGNDSNAYTAKEVTAYYITTASRFFDRALDLLADQLKNATFPDEEVETQKGVILNEMNMAEDDPSDVVNELWYATAFRVHSVRYPIIGYRELFLKLTRADIVKYYERMYVPENVLVVVVGDVNAEEVIAKVDKAFSDFRRTTPPHLALSDEPPQMGPRRAAVERDIQLAYMVQGYHTVPITSPDVYPLDVLASILGQGDSSRLNQRVKEQQRLVISVSASSYTPGYNAGVFTIDSVVEPEKLEKAEQAILNDIARLRTELVSDAELAKAKRRIEALWVRSKQTVEDQAELIAYDELSTGNPNFSQQYVAKIQGVTKEDVRRVASKYLVRDNYTVAIVRPSLTFPDAKGEPPPSSPLAREEIREGAPTAVAATVRPAQKFVFPNGVRLVVRENHSVPVVSTVVVGRGGVRCETAHTSGVFNLMSHLFTRGTKKRTAEQIAEEVDRLGGSLEGFSGYNSFGITAEFLSRDFAAGFEMMADALLHPTFPQKELEKQKEDALAAMRQQEDEPFAVASKLLSATLYTQHPYRFPVLGTPESVKRLTRSEVVDTHRRYVVSRNLVIAVYGDVRTDTVRRVAARYFGALSAADAALPHAPSEPPLTQSRQAVQKKSGIQQTVLFFGFSGITVNDPDRYAFDVLDAVLSGIRMPGGRLFARLRGGQFVYDANAFPRPGLDPGHFVVYAATTRDKKQQVLDILREEVQRLARERLDEEECRRGQSEAIASHEVALQTNAAQAQQAALDELYGLGYEDSRRYAERITAVTPADVQRVAQRYLNLERAALAVVEPDR